MSNDKLFEKQEDKKLMSISVSITTINRLNDFVKDKKIKGFKVNKSVLAEKAINNFLDQLEQNENGLFGGM